ncbi:unnamed protein product [Schistosoma rodhaini]|uniref:acid phosphatase n=1 Tax=Schistosoma rodhaini TaxID=6188 RepID=A0AA85FQ00_9TREM|nr:unnamed protein product [Schistosoma rodhaini]
MSLGFSSVGSHILNAVNVNSVSVSLAILTTLINPCSVVDVRKNIPSTNDLLMVFILCRHGDRSPVHTFPTDPYRKLWKMGYGQLTAYGAEQHHELGRVIRKMYSDFVPEVYHKDETLFRSSGTERTLMSANNFIRGFYHLEKKSTNNVPPVFSRLAQEDHLLKMSSKCPKFERLFHQLMNSSVVSQKANILRNFFDLLEHTTGKLIKSQSYDSLQCLLVRVIQLILCFQVYRIKPPLASCLIVELHRSLSSNNFYLRFYYLNETKLPLKTDKIVNLWPTKCETRNDVDGKQLNYSCPFQKLELSLQGTYATDIGAECYDHNAVYNVKTTFMKPSGMQMLESYCYHPQLLTFIFFQTAIVCYLVARFFPIPMAYLINNFRYSRHVQ